MSRVSEAFREARVAAKMTQASIARALRVSQPFVNDIEHGRRELGEQHYENLPQPIRSAVVRAAIAELQERISKLRQLIK